MTSLVGVAHAAEYRKVDLLDGRTIIGMVQDTTPLRMQLQVPQGQVEIPLTQVMSLSSVSEEAYLAQPPWLVVVLPFVSNSPSLADETAALRQQVIAQVQTLSGVLLQETAQLKGELTEDQIAALDACGIDASCAIPIAQQAQVDVVIMGAYDLQPNANELLLATAFPGAARAQSQVVLPISDHTQPRSSALHAQLQTALLLVPQAITDTVVQAPAEEPPPPVKPQLPSQPPDNARYRRMAWVPLPGLPALARGDLAGFAQSWAIVAPASVLAIGVSGAATTSRTGFAAMGLLSTYAITVATNHAVGLRGLDGVSVSAAPNPEGGANLQVSVTR